MDLFAWSAGQGRACLWALMFCRAPLLVGAFCLLLHIAIYWGILTP